MLNSLHVRSQYWSQCVILPFKALSQSCSCVFIVWGVTKATKKSHIRITVSFHKKLIFHTFWWEIDILDENNPAVATEIIWNIAEKGSLSDILNSLSNYGDCSWCDALSHSNHPSACRNTFCRWGWGMDSLRIFSKDFRSVVMAFYCIQKHNLFCNLRISLFLFTLSSHLTYSVCVCVDWKLWAVRGRNWLSLAMLPWNRGMCFNLFIFYYFKTKQNIATRDLAIKNWDMSAQFEAWCHKIFNIQRPGLPGGITNDVLRTHGRLLVTAAQGKNDHGCHCTYRPHTSK